MMSQFRIYRTKILLAFTLLPFSLLPFTLLLLSLSLFSCSGNTLKIHLEIEESAPQIQYGISQLQELAVPGNITFSGDDPDLTVHCTLDTINLPAEAFWIETEAQHVKITGGDPTGLMYGLLDLREQLEQGNQPIESRNEQPFLSFRAIKHNLPWNSYRNSEALSLHYETCRDTSYWESFLDMMAENRFNKLTLWNLHPFNYMVKTKKYPEACGFSDEEMAQWEKLWHALFRMAKERGIETYIINWNIFVSPEFAEAHNVAPYCITNDFYVEQGDTSEIIKDYTREAVREVIDTYPDLTGLGITLGEGMGGMTAEEREQWLFESYIAGMRQASRKVKFIHRVPLSAGTGSGGSTSVTVEKMTRRAIDTLTCVDGPVNIELKFNWSHAFSTPHLVKVHGGKLTDAYWNPMPENYKLAWMMRNEDFFMLRWGQPDFIREHLSLNVHPFVNGYFTGSETYIPAKDYITALPGASYSYAFERQWMFYKVMGRLFYNPKTPDDVFIDAFEHRFPGQGEKLFSAQSKVSRVPLMIASIYNGTADLSLYSEGFLCIVFIDGERFVRLMPLTALANRQPLDPNYLSVSEWLDTDPVVPEGKRSPIQLADSLDAFCSKALREVADIEAGENVDLMYEVSDIHTWANLGMYLSNKLRAAVVYKKFTLSGEKADLEQSVDWLEKAIVYWHELVEITEPIYDAVPLVDLTRNENEDDHFHWSIIEKQVLDELEWLKSQYVSEDVQ